MQEEVWGGGYERESVSSVFPMGLGLKVPLRGGGA